MTHKHNKTILQVLFSTQLLKHLEGFQHVELVHQEKLVFT